MEPDELAELRREHFGFIFQRYHLLGDLSALGNAEVRLFTPGSRAQRVTRVQDRFSRGSAWPIDWGTSPGSFRAVSSSA